MATEDLKWGDVLRHCDELIAEEEAKMKAAKYEVWRLQASRRFFKKQMNESGMKCQEWFDTLGGIRERRAIVEGK